jgi:hypothetical protein
MTWGGKLLIQKHFLLPHNRSCKERLRSSEASPCLLYHL